MSGPAKPLDDVPANKVRALLEQQRAKDIAEAREDFDTFAELVAKDDETGEPIRQAKIHRAWTRLAAKHDQLLIWAHRYAGKTVQLSILRTVWKLGRDPSLRFLILSSTQERAKDIVSAIASYILDDTVREIFPDLARDREGNWSAMRLDIIGKRDKKNSSVLACGVGTALRGARCDELVIDDILLPENVATADQRSKVSRWVRAEAFGALSKRARILIVGNAMHPDDILHELAKQKDFHSVRFPILNAAGESTWPDAWPMARIDKTRTLMGPAEFVKNMMCRARSDEDSRFKQEWIDEALKKGARLSLINSLSPEDLPEGCTVWTGVDLGVSKKKKSDKTAFFTFLEDPNGNRTLLNLQSGKFTGPQIVEKIVELHRLFGSIIAVENNAAQDFLLQFARETSNVPIMPHTTTRMKRDPIFGVEGLAIELANGKWIIPSSRGKIAKEVALWIEEMLYYTPKAHTGDRLMACYFARELARRILGSKQGSAEVSVTIVGSDDIEPANDIEEKGELERLFDVPETAADRAAMLAEQAIANIRAKIANMRGKESEPDESEDEAEDVQAAG